MFTEKDLVAGETVLVWKERDAKVLYLGCAGLVHFISEDDDFKKAGDCNFTIKQPKSNAVPLEKKVYDFVPVRCRFNDKSEWVNYKLVAVCDYKKYGYPYIVIDEDGFPFAFRYCEFLNEQ